MGPSGDGSLRFYYDPQLRGLARLGQPLCVGFILLLLFVLKKSPPKNGGDAAIALALLLVAILSIPLFRWLDNLLAVSVELREDGLAIVRGEVQEKTLGWHEVRSLSYSRFMMRLTLHADQRDRDIRVEKQLVGYAEVLGAIETRTGRSVEIRWW